MNRRSVALYIASGFAIGILLLSVYFFIKRPERSTAPVAEETKRVVVFRDVNYSGERKGAVDWELKAAVARKFIDRPIVELEKIEGSYRPKPDTVVLFRGSKGELDTEAEKGRIDDVEIVYKDEYTVRSKVMDFDFKNARVWTKSAVDLKGKRLTMQGVGMVADTRDQVVIVEKDVQGSVKTDTRHFKFSSERFTYRVKEDLYTFDGNVSVKSDDMDMLCDTVSVISKDDKVEKIDARGKVRLTSKGTLAKSGRAVYYFKDDRVTLEDSPVVTRDKAEMRGQKIVYNLSTGKFSVETPKMRLQR
jgi:lipopolysaccharide transport protein LptA/LPS export ABC transporter protein LptC